LIITRFLQAAFPNVNFIVIRRHPIAVSRATQNLSFSSLHSLFEHWLRCYDLFEQDRQYLTRVYELTYEDYIANPTKHHRQIADFIGTRATSDQMESLSSAHNRKYLDRWSNLLAKSPWKTYYLYIASKYEPKFAKYNYSLMKELDMNLKHLGSETKRIGSRVGVLYCLGADVSTFFWRLHVRKMDLMTTLISWILPRRIKDRNKDTLHTKQLHRPAGLLALQYINEIQNC